MRRSCSTPIVPSPRATCARCSSEPVRRARHSSRSAKPASATLPRAEASPPNTQEGDPMSTVSYLPQDASSLTRASTPAMIKIYALGPFSLVVDGKPLTFARKAKSKPLELLKALIAHGGQHVRQDTLAEALWPDSEADLAAYSLTSTLHRLRMLIGASTIQRQAGCLSLNSSRCWVDAWSFERTLAALERAHRAQDLEAMAGLTARSVLQYRGPFLAG